ERGARGAVAGADEAKLAIQLGVVVPRDDDALLARTRDRGDEVHHVHFVERGLIVPRLLRRDDAAGGELLADVLAGLLDGGGAGRPRADGDELPKMLPG